MPEDRPSRFEQTQPVPASDPDLSRLAVDVNQASGDPPPPSSPESETPELPTEPPEQEAG